MGIMREWVEERFEFGLALAIVAVTAVAYCALFVPLVLLGSVAKLFERSPQPARSVGDSGRNQ